MRRPNWRRGYLDSYERVRDQLRRDRARASGRVVWIGEERYEVSMMSDDEIDAYAWREAQRTAEYSIRRWNDGEDDRKRAMGEL